MNKIIFISTAVIGVAFAIIGAIILWGVMPGAIRNKVADEVWIANKTGEAYERFEKLSVPLKFKIYFFNVTNPGEWNKKDVKSIKFTEVGPYVYTENRWKEEIEFSTSGDNVTFIEKKNYTFSAAESIQDGRQLSEDDQMTIINPALGAISTFLGIFNTTITEVAYTDTVGNIAFKGMTNSGTSLFTCPKCEVPRLVETGKSHISHLNRIYEYNHEHTQNIWNLNGSCNAIHGTDGTQFHPDVKSSDTLYVFEPMLCRSIKLIHGLSDEAARDIDTLRFYAGDENFEASKANECFCYEENHDDCPAGTLNLRNCEPAKSANVDIISSPPYFRTNPALLNDSGLKPPKELTQENYGTILDVEPYTGIVLRARKRLQLNVLFKRGEHTLLTELEKHRLFMPLAWIEESGDVDEANAQKLKEKVFAPKRVAQGLLIGAMALGVLLIAVAGACAYFGR